MPEKLPPDGTDSSRPLDRALRAEIHRLHEERAQLRRRVSELTEALERCKAGRAWAESLVRSLRRRLGDDPGLGEAPFPGGSGL